MHVERRIFDLLKIGVETNCVHPDQRDDPSRTIKAKGLVSFIFLLCFQAQARSDRRTVPFCARRLWFQQQTDWRVIVVRL